MQTWLVHLLTLLAAAFLAWRAFGPSSRRQSSCASCCGCQTTSNKRQNTSNLQTQSPPLVELRVLIPKP